MLVVMFPVKIRLVTVKFLGSQKLYADFCLTGLTTLNPMSSGVNCLM